MSDIVFKIVAKKIGSERFGYDWDVRIDDHHQMLLSLTEWPAFRSLFTPSAKADFTIQEIDENGQTLR